MPSEFEKGYNQAMADVFKFAAQEGKTAADVAEYAFMTRINTLPTQTQEKQPMRNQKLGGEYD